METSLSLCLFLKWTPKLSLSSSFFPSASLAHVQWPWKRLTSKMAAVSEGQKNSFFSFFFILPTLMKMETGWLHGGQKS